LYCSGGFRIGIFSKSDDPDYKLLLAKDLDACKAIEEYIKEIAWVEVKQPLGVYFILVPTSKCNSIQEIATKENISITPADFEQVRITNEQRTEAYQRLYERTLLEDIRAIYHELGKGPAYVYGNQDAINGNISKLLDRIKAIANQFNNEERQKQFYTIVKDDVLGKNLKKIRSDLKVQRKRKY
jgi:hypothetical protein